MKIWFNLSFLLVAFILTSCGTDDPQPVEPAPPVIEQAATEEPPVEKESVVGQPTPVTFPDSAFYQPGIFNAMPYQIMFPRNYDATQSYPIVIFLHGSDERGTDNEKQLKWGASLFKSDSVSRKYPAFVVFPQCPVSTSWNDPAILKNLKGLVDNLISTRSIDPNRVYIEGLSMGAYGTYAMVAAYPDLFAAAIAISGDGDQSKANQMAKVDWKIYGGTMDTVVPGERSERMAEALRRSGASVSLTIYPSGGHVGTWVKAFAEPDYSSWIFSMSRD